MISIGIDVGKNKCVATLKRDGGREILEQMAFQNRSSGILRVIERAKMYGGEEAKAVVESTGNYWIRVHDVLEEHGIDTPLANPIQTKAIAKARLKDDRLDSNILADLLRADLVPESFVPDKEHRELRQLARTRIDLVANRARFEGKIHAILAKYEHECPVTHVFSMKGIEWLKSLQLSWVDRMAMDAYLEPIETLTRRIDVFTAKIASLCSADERARLLMTIPGVDYVTALTILSEIVDINRFSTPWKLVAYAGLAPSRRDSGETTKRGGITREGSRWLRYAVVEAANTACRIDGRLGTFYERIASRRGPQKARVATGKEMLVIIWHMLRNNEPYRTMDRRMVQGKYIRMERRARGSA